MEVEKHHQKNNKILSNTMLKRLFKNHLTKKLFFLIIWVFNQISFVLNPFWTFFNAILPPVLVASIQYYLMDPVVDWMEKKLKVPRIITIILLFVIVLGGLIWIINTLIPIIQHQTDSLIKNWPAYWQDAQKGFEKMIHDPRLNGVRSGINQVISDAQTKMFKTGQDSFNLALSNLSSAVNVITMIFMTLLTAPFVLFFMLKDGHRLNPYVTKFAPQKLQPSFSSLLSDINGAVASYIRGQITVSFWVGVMFAIGYSVIGLNYGITLAVLAGVLNMIPYFGTFIAFIPAIILGLISSPMMLVKVLIVFAIEQTLEGRVISPLVMGNKMNMNPVTTILLLIGASAVAGLWGVIFAIPVYAVIKIIVTRLFNYYRKISTLYDEISESDDANLKSKE